MFDSSLRSAGREYTAIGALLAVAFIFIPALVAVSQPLRYLSVSVAIVCSALCVTLAWVYWKRSLKVSIPSVATQGGAAK